MALGALLFSCCIDFCWLLFFFCFFLSLWSTSCMCLILMELKSLGSPVHHGFIHLNDSRVIRRLLFSLLFPSVTEAYRSQWHFNFSLAGRPNSKRSCWFGKSALIAHCVTSPAHLQSSNAELRARWITAAIKPSRAGLMPWNEALPPQSPSPLFTTPLLWGPYHRGHSLDLTGHLTWGISAFHQCFWRPGHLGSAAPLPQNLKLHSRSLSPPRTLLRLIWHQWHINPDYT